MFFKHLKNALQYNTTVTLIKSESVEHDIMLKCKPSAQLHGILQQPAHMLQVFLVYVHSIGVSCLVLYVAGSVHVRTVASYTHALTWDRY